jgi:hypothetical protein
VFINAGSVYRLLNTHDVVQVYGTVCDLIIQFEEKKLVIFYIGTLIVRCSTDIPVQTCHHYSVSIVSPKTPLIYNAFGNRLNANLFPRDNLPIQFAKNLPE